MLSVSNGMRREVSAVNPSECFARSGQLGDVAPQSGFGWLVTQTQHDSAISVTFWSKPCEEIGYIWSDD